MSEFTKAAKTAKHPIVNPNAQAIIEKRGLAYEVEMGVPPEDIDQPTEGTQVRLDKHIAPSATVNAYAVAMRGGTIFPAVVVDRDNRLLDGNTRRAASIKAGKVLNVIRLTDELSEAETRLLQTALNNSNGVRLTSEETRRVVDGIVQSGAVLDPGAISRDTGVAKNTIGRWTAGAEFTARAARVGVSADALDGLGVMIASALNKLTSDEFIPSAVALTKDANLSAKELASMVSAVNGALRTSGESAHAELTRLRSDDYAARIRETASGVSRPSAMARYHKHIKAVASIDSADVYSMPVASVQGFIEAADDAIANLQLLRNSAATRLAPEAHAS